MRSGNYLNKQELIQKVYNETKLKPSEEAELIHLFFVATDDKEIKKAVYTYFDIPFVLEEEEL